MGAQDFFLHACAARRLCASAASAAPLSVLSSCAPPCLFTEHAPQSSFARRRATTALSCPIPQSIRGPWTVIFDSFLRYVCSRLHQGQSNDDSPSNCCQKFTVSVFEWPIIDAAVEALVQLKPKQRGRTYALPEGRHAIWIR